MVSISSMYSSCPVSRRNSWGPGGNIENGTRVITPYLTRRIRELSSVHPVDDNDAFVDADDVNMEDNYQSTCELDSHANMAVVGSESYIIEETGEIANVQPYSPDYECRELKVIHAGVLYQCPYTGIEYILVIRNAIYVPSMKINLIPPFLIREAGIQLKDQVNTVIRNEYGSIGW